MWQATSDTWHVTCDMWHVTYDTWHVTRDMWHVTCDMLWGVYILSKFRLPSSSGLWFMICWKLGGKGWLNEWMSNEADCRTAPPTLGPLIITYTRIEPAQNQKISWKAFENSQWDSAIDIHSHKCAHIYKKFIQTV